VPEPIASNVDADVGIDNLEIFLPIPQPWECWCERFLSYNTFAMLPGILANTVLVTAARF